MKSIYFNVHRRGGIAATHELLRDGHNSHQLTAAVRNGDIIRVRQGHYACPEVSEAEQRAVRVGGRLTGMTGAAFHGIWTPGRTPLSVAVRPGARALRSPTNKNVRLAHIANPGVHVAWNDPGAMGTRSVLNPLFCLDAIIRSQPEAVAFAAAESALNKGLVSMAAWQRYFESIPRRKKGRLMDAGRLSESGGESLVKFQLVVSGIEFRQQVKIAGAGRIDFLIGHRLVIEADGAEFHTNPAAFEEDRRRDAVLSALGYRVLRFSYKQITRRWPEVETAILAAIARGDDRR